MSQMNPLQQLIQSLTKAPPAAGPGITQGNAPSPQDLISKLMAFIHPQQGAQPQPSPSPSPLPPSAGQMQPHQIPQMLMQLMHVLTQMGSGKGQPPVGSGNLPSGPPGV
jgi:hypothetical protein